MNFLKQSMPPVVGTLSAVAVNHWETLSMAGSAALGIGSGLYILGCLHAKRLEVKKLRLQIENEKNKK